MNAVVHFYLNNISYRNSGASNSKVGNATTAQVLSGKTFTNASGVGLTGTMANQAAWTNTPTASTKVKIPAGYHNGSGYVDTATVYTNGYNKGVTDADARTNTNSANYQAGYNAGITFADGRTNVNSANYKTGYSEGIMYAKSNISVSEYVLTAYKTGASSSGVPAKYYFKLTNIPNYSSLELHKNLFYEFFSFSISNAGNGDHSISTSYDPSNGEFILSVYYMPAPSSNSLKFYIIN